MTPTIAPDNVLLRLHVAGRINVIHRIQTWYLANGSPPIDDVRAAGGALAAAKALRCEVKYLKARAALIGEPPPKLDNPS